VHTHTHARRDFVSFPFVSDASVSVTLPRSLFFRFLFALELRSDFSPDKEKSKGETYPGVN
jgi:hypothetical protein